MHDQHGEEPVQCKPSAFWLAKNSKKKVKQQKIVLDGPQAVSTMVLGPQVNKSDMSIK